MASLQVHNAHFFVLTMDGVLETVLYSSVIVLRCKNGCQGLSVLILYYHCCGLACFGKISVHTHAQSSGIASFIRCELFPVQWVGIRS